MPGITTLGNQVFSEFGIFRNYGYWESGMVIEEKKEYQESKKEERRNSREEADEEGDKQKQEKGRKGQEIKQRVIGRGMGGEKEGELR